MHLMTALEMKQPGVIFRGTILLAQGKTMLCIFTRDRLWLIWLISSQVAQLISGIIQWFCNNIQSSLRVAVQSPSQSIITVIII